MERLEQTRQIAGLLAASLAGNNPGALLLYGDLGAGKTTLVRFLVESLPGGKDAEVASPSFTICNIYCTAPRVYHFDLYRLEPGVADEGLEESLDDAGALTIVEWAERIAAKDMPADGIACRLGARAESGTTRKMEFAAFGPAGERCLAHFLTAAKFLPA